MRAACRAEPRAEPLGAAQGKFTCTVQVRDQREDFQRSAHGYAYCTYLLRIRYLIHRYLPHRKGAQGSSACLPIYLSP